MIFVNYTEKLCGRMVTVLDYDTDGPWVKSHLEQLLENALSVELPVNGFLTLSTGES